MTSTALALVVSSGMSDLELSVRATALGQALGRGNASKIDTADFIYRAAMGRTIDVAATYRTIVIAANAADPHNEPVATAGGSFNAQVAKLNVFAKLGTAKPRVLGQNDRGFVMDVVRCAKELRRLGRATVFASLIECILKVARVEIDALVPQSDEQIMACIAKAAEAPSHTTGAAEPAANAPESRVINQKANLAALIGTAKGHAKLFAEDDATMREVVAIIEARIAALAARENGTAVALAA
jgi:hypothetical protein